MTEVLRAAYERVLADSRAAGARVDQRIAAYVADCRKADLARQKRPVSSWINPTVIAAWLDRRKAASQIGA